MTMTTSELSNVLAFIQEGTTMEPSLSADVMQGLNRVFHLLARVADGKETPAAVTKELSGEVARLRRVLPASKAKSGGWAATILTTAEKFLGNDRVSRR
jgi:hypothetical protein